MTTLNEAKYAALATATGSTGTLNELESFWLELRGHDGTLNEKWMQEFQDAGFGNLTFNGAAAGWLNVYGYTGTLNERWYQFWTRAGGIVPPVNLVTNSRFTTDTGWTKGTGWTIAGGTAIRDPAVSVSSLDQAVSVSGGVGYRLRYDIVEYVAGELTVSLGGRTFDTRTAVGSYIENFTAISAASLSLSGNNPLSAKIDNVYLVEILDTP